MDPVLYPAPVWFAGVVTYLHVWDTTLVVSVPGSRQLVASPLLSGWCQISVHLFSIWLTLCGHCVCFMLLTGDTVASSFASLSTRYIYILCVCVCVPQVTLPCGSVEVAILQRQEDSELVP